MTETTDLTEWMTRLIESEIGDAFAAEAAGQEQTGEEIRARAQAVAKCVATELLRGYPPDDGWVIPRGIVPRQFVEYGRALRKRLAASLTETTDAR